MGGRERERVSPRLVILYNKYVTIILSFMKVDFFNFLNIFHILILIS